MPSYDREPTDELHTLIAAQRERVNACEDLLRQLRIHLEDAPDALTRETVEANIQSVLSCQRRYQAYLGALTGSDS